MNMYENVRQVMLKLVPSSVLSDIACFVFYDNHPKDGKKIDITVFTKSGELREYFHRDLQSSLDLHCVVKTPSELRILRNNNSELFYLLVNKDELLIISSQDQLKIHKKLVNIDRYEVNDAACSGEACLKVIKRDDAIPLRFDSNFESLEDRGIMPTPQNSENSMPILNDLKRKLVEARYSTKCNQNTYAQYLNLHQKVSLWSYQSQQKSNGSVFVDDNVQNIGGSLKLKINKPWVKVCNKKVVIMFNALLQGEEPISNIQILLNNASTPSLVYTTKIFTKLPSPPHWHEANTMLKPGQECAIAAVISLDKVQRNLGRIELNGSVSYEVLGMEFLLSFEDVIVSSMEVLGDEFDVLSSSEINEHTILAILAATEKMDLCFRHIKNDGDPHVSMLDLFCTHLQMNRVENASNVVVYRKSPYHALNGTMLVFHETNSDKSVPVTVHTRSSSQVLALIRYIHDSIPAKIIVTTPTYKITAKSEQLTQYSEEFSNADNQTHYMNYATSLIKRSAKILEYLDASMIRMSESKNPLVQSKLGSHIDLFAGGVDVYKEFRDSMLKDGQKGINALTEIELTEEGDGGVMVID